MSDEFLKSLNFQPLVDTLVRTGKQLNKHSYRMLKGELIGIGVEKISNGRLKYVDKAGYDNIDLQTGIKYELKSLTNMFSKKGEITGRVSLANTNKEKLQKTFDYLLCIQSNPNKFAVCSLTWQECFENHTSVSGQFNLERGIKVTNWICKPNTTKCNNLPQTDLKIKECLMSVFRSLQ